MKTKVLFLNAVLLFQFFALTGAEEGFIISGKVTDHEGNNMAGASVVLSGTFRGVLTGDDGKYFFENIRPGNNKLIFSFTGYETREIDFVLTSDTVIYVVLEQITVITDDVVISATRAGDKAPLAYTNVQSDILDRLGAAQDMPYLLTLTPSLIETSESGNGVGYTSMRIRGTDGSRINVTIDGIPLNDAESQQVFWVDLPDLASSVDNIQVQRGVGTSSNGAGAFGASVNIQTRGIENDPFAEVTSSAGSFGTFRNNIAAGTGLMKGKFAFQMRYSDMKSDGYIKRTGSDHQSAFISGLYRTGKSLIRTNIILGKEHTGIGWWGVPGEMLKIDRRYNPAGEYTDETGKTMYYGNESDNYTQNHFQLIFSRNLNNELSLHAALHYTKGKGYYEEFREDEPYNDYGLDFLRISDTTIYTSDLVRRKWMSNDFYGVVYSLKYRKKKIEATFGGGLNLYSGDHFGRIIWMKYPGTAEKDYQWYFNKGEKKEASVYGKVNLDLSTDVSLFTDLQYRYINYVLDGIDDDLKSINQAHRFNFFNPKTGLFFNLGHEQEAYVSLSVANREPTRSDYKEASGDNEATPRPERLYDAEAGYRLKLSKSIFAVNLYGMYYKDQLVPTGELSNVGYPIMTNVDKSYRLGAEIIVGFIPLNPVDWNFSLTFSRNKIMNFTEYYLDYNTSDWSSEYKSKKLGTVDIAYSPSVTGTSDLSFTVTDAIKIHLISKYAGKQYFDNTMNSERMLDPYFVNNIVIGYTPRVNFLGKVEMQAIVNNIFNTMYENNAYGGNWYEDGQEKTWSYYFPQAGTNFMFKLSLTF